MAWKIFNPNKGMFIAFDNQSKEYSEVGSMGLAAHWHKKKEATRVLGRKIPRNMRSGYSVFETREAKKLWEEKVILNSASEAKDRKPVEWDLPADDCEPEAELGLSIVTESAAPAQIVAASAEKTAPVLPVVDFTLPVDLDSEEADLGDEYN